MVELFSNFAMKSASFISSVSWDAFSQKLGLFHCLPRAWEMQQMLLGLENEGRGMGMVCCGCAKCPVGLCRSLQHPSAVTGLPGGGASCGQTDVVVVVRCFSLTPSFVGLQIFGSWCYLCIFNWCGVRALRVFSLL